MIDGGQVKLSTLVEKCLNKTLYKGDEVRLSRWSAEKLSNEQKVYAAVDAISTLHVYNYLKDKPDYSLRCQYNYRRAMY